MFRRYSADLLRGLAAREPRAVRGKGRARRRSPGNLLARQEEETKVRRSESKDKFHPPEVDFEEGLNDEELFERAMEGVRRLPDQDRILRSSGKRRESMETVYPADLMEEAVEDIQELKWPFAPGYLEGGDQQWNRRLVRRLRRGRFAVQAELDLHGYSQVEAREELNKFLRACSERGLFCVRVIHGQGHHSPNQRPVLKRRLPEWLRWKQNARYVAAFTSARPNDGGGGAVYVLLSKINNRKG